MKLTIRSRLNIVVREKKLKTATGFAKAMTEAGYTSAQMVQIRERLQDADNEPATRAALVSKVREGLAKQVGPEAIVRATERVRERYRVALGIARTLPGQVTPRSARSSPTASAPAWASRTRRPLPLGCAPGSGTWTGSSCTPWPSTP